MIANVFAASGAQIPERQDIANVKSVEHLYAVVLVDALAKVTEAREAPAEQHEQRSPTVEDWEVAVLTTAKHSPGSDAAVPREFYGWVVGPGEFSGEKESVHKVAELFVEAGAMLPHEEDVADIASIEDLFEVWSPAVEAVKEMKDAQRTAQAAEQNQDAADKDSASQNQVPGEDFRGGKQDQLHKLQLNMAVEYHHQSQDQDDVEDRVKQNQGTRED